MNGVEAVGTGCPYCGEIIELLVDCSVQRQSYTEDCEVCCRPIDIKVTLDADGVVSLAASREDDG